MIKLTNGMLATCSSDKSIRLWDVIKMKCAATFKAH